MCTRTLPARAQPDEPPDVQPCHRGKAAKVCAFDIALLESLSIEGTCISCGAPYGQPHYSHCRFQTSAGAS